MLTISPHVRLPGWVTEQSLRYLAHTEAGRSIRDLARDQNVHPSTILRQIRRLETRRDDPLVDEALTSLGQIVGPAPTRTDRLGSQAAIQKGRSKMPSSDRPQSVSDTAIPSDAEIAREAPRVLRRLCETGSVLAFAADMDKAVVVRDASDGSSARTAVVDRAVVQAMALNEWISCQTAGRIARYVITPAGRAALNQMTAQQENRRAADPEGADDPMVPGPADNGGGGGGQRARYAVTESPLTALSRRKDRTGAPFLSEDLVAAGERLREDYELAQIQAADLRWEGVLTIGVRAPASQDAPQFGQNPAQDRVLAALQDLGPGLADVALRCCCFLQGLETAEKTMGWSARSGKIVLRIALQRLKRHYAERGSDQRLIG